jgi:hypothetical protein
LKRVHLKPTLIGLYMVYIVLVVST